jgi:hypothetical protein
LDIEFAGVVSGGAREKVWRGWAGKLKSLCGNSKSLSEAEEVATRLNRVRD